MSDFATLELPGETTEEELVQNLYEHWNLLTPSEKAKAHGFIQGALTKKARSDFYTYVRLMAPVILPEGFIDGKHIKLMSEELQVVERRTARSSKLRLPQDTSPVVLGKRLQIFLPPGSMKSKILNLFVTWAFGRHPKWNIMHIGHSTQFAEDNMGRQIRDVMNAPEYAEIFPGTLIKKDVKAAGRWETTKGGKYYATGVGTRIAGRRAHISIVDDAVSEQTAYSKVERPKINEWYGRGLRTRVLPGGSEIIVNCLVADTDVWTNQGKKKITEIALGDKVLSYNQKEDALEYKNVSGIWDNGEDEIWEVTLQDSTVIRGNAKHPLLTQEGYVPLEDLDIDKHRVLSQWYMGSLDKGEKISVEEGYLLGFMFGDGWTNNSQRTGGKQKGVYRWVTCWSYGIYEELNTKVLKLFQKLFGITMNKTKFGYYRTDYRHVCEWFRTYGLVGNAHTKRLPKWVFQQKEEIREAVYAGLIASDGHIDKAGMIRFGMCNPDLVQDIKDLARSLGYKASKVWKQEYCVQPPNSPEPIDAIQYGLSIGKTQNKESTRAMRLKSVVNTGEKEKVYDLTIEDNHNFVIDNGVISSNTRWHVDDLSGYLLKADESSKMPWKVIAIPAILDAYSAGLLGLPAGHSYWPEFWTDAMLQEKRSDKAFSEAAWNALYMQNPVPEEGNIFKESLFQYWTENDPPALDYIITSVDTAFSTREKADFSAYTVWGVFKDVEEDLAGQELLVSNMILLEAEEGRWEFPELCLKMREINDVYQPDTFVVEKKASGQSLIQEMRRRNFPVTEYIPDKDKISRAHACTPFMEAKRIWVPSVRLDDETTRPRSFAEDLIQQAIQFPFAAHDDLTDTFTQAILWMRDAFAVSHPEYDEDEEIEAQSAVRFSYWNMVNPKGF